jgi:hypothetical protein
MSIRSLLFGFITAKPSDIIIRKPKGTIINMVAQLVEVLPYKLEGRGFDSR